VDRTVRLCHAGERFSFIGIDPPRPTPARKAGLLFSGFGNNNPSTRVNNQNDLAVQYISDTIGGHQTSPIEDLIIVCEQRPSII
jgi:hypothetical protein